MNTKLKFLFSVDNCLFMFCVTGQVFNFNFEDGPGHYQATKEGRPKDDYSYMGRSWVVLGGGGYCF